MLKFAILARNIINIVIIIDEKIANEMQELKKEMKFNILGE